MAAIFIFSLKKFIENPAGITFIMALPTLLGILINPIASFVSDRIWTKWGRRKPFVVPSLFGTVVAFALMPLMPNFWGLIAVFIFYHFMFELGAGATETLKQEVVPPKQRTAAAAIGTWMSNIVNVLFYFCALGRFDDVQYFAGFPISGEESIYWGIAAVFLVLAMFFMLGVKETPQQSKLLGQKLSVRNFFGGLVDKNLWPVYLLITGWAVSHAGLGSLGALLYTEQWGFTKQEMGINVAVGGVLNIFIIAIIGLFAYKLPRMKTFKVLLLLSILIELAFYIYVEFVLFDKTPTLPEVILFGEIATIVGILLGLMYTPLVYDYIPRNEMGTFAAGQALVNRLVKVLTLNGVGVFVSLYTMLFLPPAGDMIRVGTAEPIHKSEVTALLAHKQEEGKVTAETWFATNAALDRGRAFEIRGENAEGDALRKERDKTNVELASVLARKGNAEAEVERARIEGRENPGAEETLRALTTEAKSIQARVDEIGHQLTESSQAFGEKVLAAIDKVLIRPGQEWMAASIGSATIYSYRLPGRPDSAREARALNALRTELPDMIDAHTTFKNDAFYFEVALPGEASQDPDGSKTAAALFRATSGRLSESAFPRFSKAEQVEPAQVLTLDVAVVEDPVNSRISPVTRAIHRGMALFTDPPPPEQRMWATARALRDKEASPHVGISDISQEEAHAIRLRSILPATPLPDGSTNEHLAALLGGTNALDIQAAANIAERLISTAAQNRITILKPMLRNEFAPPKYDYMSGYLWMILMSAVGYGICIMFTRREERGLIHRRGQEESEKEAQAQAESSAQAAAEGREDDSLIPYIPGCVPQKIAMLAFSVTLIAIGLILVFPRLDLVLFGQSTQALATRVVKERPGGDSIILTTDAEILESRERFDRSYVFWNEFRFQNVDGTMVDFRAPSGMQLRPAHSLLDAEGLPTIVRVAFDPANPEKIILPFEISTWFFPGMLILFGLLGTIASSYLLYYARKPVMMPNLIAQPILQ